METGAIYFFVIGWKYFLCRCLCHIHPDHHAARTLHNKTWGRSIKTVQPCRARWPSAAQHWGCLWAGSGCWELRVSRSCPLIDDTICGSLPVRALNFGWRETKASCVPVWSLCSTVPVGVVLVGGGAAGPGGDHRLHTAGFSRALGLELASCRGICISRINKEQQQKKPPWFFLSDTVQSFSASPLVLVPFWCC